MRLARCTPLMFFMAGLCLVSSEVDYSEEQWKTRYAPLKCEKPPKVYHMPTKYILWFYNVTATKCESFFSKTRIQHGNSFGSKKACNKFCRDKHYGMCASAKNESLCGKRMERRFWFNPDTKKCEGFLYGGCDPNSNVFPTMLECIQECAEFIDDICSLPIDEGTCLWTETRFGYNRPFRACEAFNYTGCGGNRNNFKSAHTCLTTCARDSRCLKHTEENFAFFRLIVTYFYDAVKNECRPTRTFFRKSAGPKYNRFLTKADCERVCMRKHIPRITFQ